VGGRLVRVGLSACPLALASVRVRPTRPARHLARSREAAAASRVRTGKRLDASQQARPVAEYMEATAVRAGAVAKTRNRLRLWPVLLARSRGLAGARRQPEPRGRFTDCPAAPRGARKLRYLPRGLHAFARADAVTLRYLPRRRKGSMYSPLQTPACWLRRAARSEEARRGYARANTIACPKPPPTDTASPAPQSQSRRPSAQTAHTPSG
jgi:hypothetical protein